MNDVHKLFSKYFFKLILIIIIVIVLFRFLTKPDATQEDGLMGEVDPSGWDTINVWLKGAKESGNEVFLVELLHLLLKCPVTVDRLRENDTPKEVKKLSKDFSTNEEIVNLSKQLVESWTLVITPNGTPSNSGSKTKKKKKGDTNTTSSSGQSCNESSHNPGPNNKVNQENENGMTNGKSRETSNNRVTESSSFMDALATPSSIGIKRKKIVKPISEALDSIKKLKNDLNRTDSNSIDSPTALKSPEHVFIKKPSTSVSSDQDSPPTSSVTDVHQVQGPCKSYPRGCINYTRGIEKGKKKAVRWVPDTILQAVKTFEVDEGERVNVWKVHQENQMADQRDGLRALSFRKKPHEIPLEMENSTPWPRLITIDVAQVNFIRGSSSNERGVQAAYQRVTLQDVYMNKELGPDSPYEPENPSTVDVKCLPKIIPLEDPTGQVSDFSQGQYQDAYMMPMPVAPSYSTNYAIDHRVVASTLATSSGLPGMSTWSSVPGPAVVPRMPSFEIREQSNRDIRTPDGRKLCHLFATKGFCKFQDKCKFLHQRQLS